MRLETGKDVTSVEDIGPQEEGESVCTVVMQHVYLINSQLFPV